MKLAKANAIKDANNYVCIGGKPSGWAAGGVAGKGTVCDKNRGERVAYVQYVIQAGDTGMDLKADQMSMHTAAVKQKKMSLKITEIIIILNDIMI